MSRDRPLSAPAAPAQLLRLGEPADSPRSDLLPLPTQTERDGHLLAKLR